MNQSLSNMPFSSGNYDKQLLFIIVLLAGTGMVMLYSASSAIGREMGDSAIYLKGHFVRLLIGFGLMTLTMHIDYKLYKKIAFPLLIIALIVLTAGLIHHRFWGTGATARWIYIGGISIQTSEFMKFSLITFIAYYLEKKKDKLVNFSDGLLPMVIVLGISSLLILKQPDFSTTALLVTVIFIMMFVGNARISHLFAIGSVGSLLMLLSLFGSSYQIERIRSYFEGGDLSGAGYQMQQSMMSLGGGGFLGIGLGESISKNLFLPTPHTDFILAIIGEEMGFLGVLFISTMFLMFFFRSLKVAKSSKDSFGLYLAVGLATSIFLYAAVNAAVVSGLLPVTGLPIPLVSYGGSNVLYTLGSVGVILNISSSTKKNKKRYNRSSN
ncbi:MAG: cell division protein FtsW [Candidatus Marinimicrobia bacterium]|nr:cell division protein FtsW [Candidatus Neomarinimicrobiota bacterium]